MTTIAIDARELCGHPTGVGRYLGEILREWGSLPEARACRFVLCAREPIDAAALHLPQAEVRAASGHGVWWEQVVFPRLARGAGADVIFAPGYSGPIATPIPVVVTIHDVSFAAHPEWYSWREGLRRRTLTRLTAYAAARVITVSEFSRREIIEHLGVSRDRVTMVYEGVVAPPVAPPSRHGARGDLVLYVGSLFNRRHIPELMEGFSRLAARRPDARLVILGENRTFPRLDIDGIRARLPHGGRMERIPYVADAALEALYAEARAFVFLSDYEGFGLTPAEALARGIPIVVLDTQISREIYGDAALYVTRPEPALIETALERALYDNDAREATLGRAAAALARYSWRECASRVLQILRESAR